MRKCCNTQCSVTTPYYIQYYVQNLYITRAKQAYKYFSIYEELTKNNAGSKEKRKEKTKVN